MRFKVNKAPLAGLLLAASLTATVPATAAQHGWRGVRVVAADGFQETPAAVLTEGRAQLALRDRGRLGIEFLLRYRELEGDITQSVGAHLHFGRTGSSGGIVAFLCGTDLVAGPPGTPECTDDGQGNGTIRGVIGHADVLAVEDQGFPAGDLGALRRAIRAGAVYLNIHTDAFPSGEVRGTSLHSGSEGADRHTDRAPAGRPAHTPGRAVRCVE